MIKLQALYGHPIDAQAFERYYFETHVPLAMSGLKRAKTLEARRVIGSPDGSPAPYYRTADVWYASVDDLKADLGSPGGQAVAADLANFASGGVTLMVTELDELPK